MLARTALWRRIVHRWAWCLLPAGTMLVGIHHFSPLRDPVLTAGLTATMTLVVAACMQWILESHRGGRP